MNFGCLVLSLGAQSRPTHEEVESAIVYMNTNFSLTADDCRNKFCSSSIDSDQRCILIHDRLFVLDIDLEWHTVDLCKDVRIEV